MKSNIAIFLTIISITFNVHSMEEDSLLMNLLPSGTGSLAVESEQIIETHEDFYAYINGGAELYIHYGFRKLAKRSYLFKGKHEMKAEIFDMAVPINAFGVYSYTRDTNNADIGQGGQYIGGSLIFWQDGYFVSLFAHEENDEIRNELFRMGRLISEGIGKKGVLPRVFHAIPQRSLVHESTFYFHHHAWQNKYRFISNDNVFLINAGVHALLSQYGDPGNRYYLLMVEYPNVKAARKAFKNATSKILPYLRHHRMAINDKGEWMGCDLKDNLLLFVIDAPSREEASYLIERTAANYFAAAG